MKDRAAALRALFEPTTVVHVGASEAGLYPADVFRSLLSSNLTVYPVNPNRTQVFGERCYRAIAELPVRPDLAVVTVRAELVPGVLTECVGAGIPSAVVFASGFEEGSAEGKSLHERTQQVAESILLLGPNCAGFANVTSGIVATRLYSRLRPGRVSFVSQSGALMMALHGSFSQGLVGLRLIVSVGNQLNLSLETVLSYFAEDEHTSVSAVFLAGISDGPALVAALQTSLERGKPVVILRAGRTSLGKQLAETHTAAVAGSERVLAAVCRQYGAVLVEDISELVSVTRLFELYGERMTGRVACLTQSGGLGSLTGDLAKLSGLELPAFSESLQRRLQELGIIDEAQRILNPIDLRGDAMRGAAVSESAAPFFEDPEIDVVVLLFAKNPNRQVEAETAACVIELFHRYEKPLVVVWVGDFEDEDRPGASAVRTIRQAGVPVFDDPGAAMRAMARVIEYYKGRDRFRAEVADGNVHPR